MVLIDTSVWVHHLREGNTRLEALLEQTEVLTHPFVIGELACGRMRNRHEILSLLQSLPQAEIAEHAEALQFIEKWRLAGSGLGFVDVHLLASGVLTGTPLWTLDKRLQGASEDLRIGYRPSAR